MAENGESGALTAPMVTGVQELSPTLRRASPDPSSLLMPVLPRSDITIKDFGADAMSSTSTLPRRKSTHGSQVSSNFSSSASSLFPAHSSFIGKESHKGDNFSIDNFHDGPFKPRKLEYLGRPHWTLLWATLPMLPIALYFVCAKITPPGPSPIGRSCDYRKSDDIEHLAMIDIHAAKGLTFTMAKALDLAWDTIVGQMGRVLHGWLFYHVAVRNLTWLNQNFAAPYHFQLNIVFDTASFGSLWATLLLLFKGKKSGRIKIVAFWMLASIVYVLLFPTIWSAATGYYQPSVPAQTLPTYRSGVFRQTDLNVCWVANLDRIVPGHEGVVVGPHVSDSTFPQLGLGSAASDWTGTEDFQSLSAYMATKRSIASFYSGRSITTSTSQTADWLRPNCSENEVPWASIWSNSTTFHCASDSETLYSTISGWQYNTVEQMRSQDLTSLRGELLDKNKTYFDAYFERHPDWNSSWTGVRLPLDPPFEGDDAWGNIVATEFHLSNESTNTGPLDLSSSVPYNSTLWWEGETINIPAPFLNVGFTQNGTRCSPGEDENGMCVCDRGKPIPWEHIANIDQDDLFCVGGQEYVWGFSSRVSRLGAFLECLWLISCYFFWISALRCGLVMRGRPGTGLARNVLDLAEAMRVDLGSDDTWAYGEKDLMRELDKCHPIGYTLLLMEEEERGLGGGGIRRDDDSPKARIRLRSVPHGMKNRRDIRIEQDTLYC